MPIYEYICTQCGEIVETFWLNDEMKCPLKDCGGEMDRKFSTFAIAGFNDGNKQRDYEEREHEAAIEKDEKDYAAEKAKIKEGDERAHKDFAHVTNARTPERARHLEARSTPGTKENIAFEAQMKEQV